MICILISKIPQPPTPSPQTRLLFCPTRKYLTKNVKIKDHLEMADISGEDIFHVSDCCQNYPHVSQKTWVIIWFLAGLTQMISRLCFSLFSIFFLSHLLFHLLRLHFFTQEHTPFSIMSSSLMCFNQWHSTNHVKALFTDSLSYSISVGAGFIFFLLLFFCISGVLLQLSEQNPSC